MMVNRSSYSKNRRHIAEGGGGFFERGLQYFACSTDRF